MERNGRENPEAKRRRAENPGGRGSGKSGQGRYPAADRSQRQQNRTGREGQPRSVREPGREGQPRSVREPGREGQPRSVREPGQEKRTRSVREPGREKQPRIQRRREKELRKQRRRRARRRFLLKSAAAVVFCAALAFLARAGWNYLQGRMEVSPERLAEEGYPESLIELLEKNPETKEFVLDYPDYQGLQEIDVSGEIEQGEIPFFLQWDKRWGYETYGSDFLAVTGCGPTCLSMVLCGLTGEARWNPLEVARWAEEQGYYVDGSGSSWDLMMTGAQSLGLTVSEVIFDETHILAALKEGTPIICVVGPGDFTASGHFLVLTGVDDSGRILLKDPNSRIRTEKSWDAEDLMGQIRNLWAYSI